MLVWLAGAVGVFAFFAWFSAVLHALLLLPHKRDDISALQLLVGGWRFYDQGTFKPSGHPVHRRFVRSVAAFFVCVVTGIGLGVLGSLT